MRKARYDHSRPKPAVVTSILWQGRPKVNEKELEMPDNPLSNRDLARKLLGQKVVAYRRELATISGGALAGLFLSQACYWSDRTSDPAGWFWKTQEQWEDETGLTRKEQETARRHLREREMIEEKREGLPALLWFRVRWDIIVDALID